MCPFLSYTMALPRIFVYSKLTSKQEVILDAVASNHILQVLKLKVDDKLIVFDGTGGEFSATIKTVVNKRQAIIVTETFIHCNNESPINIHIGQGISRGEKMDFTIQKTTELGVKTITPLFTERCNIKLKDHRLEKRLTHWQKVAISGSEQSGRCYVPDILHSQSLKDWLTTTSGLCLVLDPHTSNKLTDFEKLPDSVTVLIGPEGGLSDNEIILAKQKNFQSVALGPRILRTETAALAIVSILQTKWGDFYFMP